MTNLAFLHKQFLTSKTINMKRMFLSVVIILFTKMAFSQNTIQATLNNGDGWYRIIESNWRGSGSLKITGISGSNRSTDITMHISCMAYGQGGSINIVNNLYYNSNHVEEIRGGTSNGKYVLDIHFVGINTPSNISITANDLTPLSTPIYNPTDNLTGKIEISGRVIGINSTRHLIYFSKGVGIGTENIGSHELAVEGSIGAREIKVEASGWSDFVFDKNYELRTLEEVQKYINKNGHLPEIPNELEVTKNGLNLGEMNAKLLQKIEELTLYLIEQNNQIQTQQTKIEQLEKGLEDLKTK